MAGPVEALVFGIQDSLAVRATAKLSPNLRVRTATGVVGTVADVVQFPGPSVVGGWMVPNQRTLVTGLPTVGASSIGLALMPSLTGLTPTGPMTVVQGDGRVSAM